MKKKYKSEISKSIVLILAIVLGGSLINSSFYPPYWIGAASVGPVILFVIYLFRTTYYTIDENILHVKAGFLVNLNIDIDKIKSISKSNSIMSSPALSLDRIDIKYGMGQSVLISPKDRKDFIADLLAKNPTIELIGLD